MDELYSIMRDLLEVDYHQEALLCMLEAMESAENENFREGVLLAGGIRYYMESLQRELKDAIGRLDMHIARDSKKKAAVSEV